MRNTIGEVLKLTIFGASHAPEIGMTLEGFPSDFEPNMVELEKFMARRAPGQGVHTTSRREPDLPIFESGIADGKTDGSVIRAIIRNTNIAFTGLKVPARHAAPIARRLPCSNQIRRKF